MPARPDHHPLADETVGDGTARDHHTIVRRPVEAPPTVPVARRVRRPGRDVRHAASSHEPEPAVVGSSPAALEVDGATMPPARPATGGGEEGSVATEYGLLAVVAATIVSVLLEWATGGGITSLLSAVLARVSELVGL